jgi:hypothetical protein
MKGIYDFHTHTLTKQHWCRVIKQYMNHPANSYFRANLVTLLNIVYSYNMTLVKNWIRI